MPAQTRILWRVSIPTLRFLGKTFIDVEREADLPPPPFVVAANHYSHFDSPVIGAALGMPIRFLALEDLFGVNRLFDWLVEGYEAISTPRHRSPIRAVRLALTALESGSVVGVFPEATRVSHWGTLPARRGAAWLALRTGVPLVPVAVVGTGRTFGLENRLRRYPIKVVVGRSIPPQGNTISLTAAWTAWMSEQIARHPGSEVSGPQRAFYDGL